MRLSNCIRKDFRKRSGFFLNRTFNDQWIENKQKGESIIFVKPLSVTPRMMVTDKCDSYLWEKYQK